MTKYQSTNSSTKLSESEAIAYWEKKLNELDDRLRASGQTVTVTEGSHGEELTASIPQGKRPARPARLIRLDGEDISVRPSLISNGVPLDKWPQGRISLEQARRLIAQHGSK